jgi:hypothetical protein
VKDADSNAEEVNPKAKKRRRGDAVDETDVPSTKKARKDGSKKKAINGASETSKPAKRGRPPKSETMENVETVAKKSSKATKKSQDADKANAEPEEAQTRDSPPPKRGRKPAPTNEADAAGNKPTRGRKKASATAALEEAEKPSSKEKSKRGRK